MKIFTPNTLMRSSEVNANFAELKAKTDYLAAPDSAWIDATMKNSWVRYSTEYPPARYRKDALGYVHLSGMIKSGITSNPLDLPAGYRPAFPEIFTCSTHSFAHCSCEVRSGGVVILVTYNNTWVSLDGIVFKAEQ